MTEPPPDLERLLASLAARLPGQVGDLVDADRFATGRQALARLADPATRASLRTLDADDRRWLAGELWRSWALIGDPVVDPVARLEPVGGPDGAVGLTVRVDGLEAGWTVAWTGAEPDPDDSRIGLTGGGPARTVTARVAGRGPDGRVILTAVWPEAGR
ncbi:MAG: hypothetical protein ACK5RL_06550 [Acidimicrobiales bacterium]